MGYLFLVNLLQQCPDADCQSVVVAVLIKQPLCYFPYGSEWRHGPRINPEF